MRFAACMAWSAKFLSNCQPERPGNRLLSSIVYDFRAIIRVTDFVWSVASAMSLLFPVARDCRFFSTSRATD